jgi:hypothetical protein
MIGSLKSFLAEMGLEVSCDVQSTESNQFLPDVGTFNSLV